MLKNKMLIAVFSMFLVLFSSMGFAKETAGQYVSDSAITADVKAKLLADSDIKSLHITVKTTHKKVTLSGYVNTDEQKEKAATIASGAEGVKGVHNKLAIKPKKD